MILTATGSSSPGIAVARVGPRIGPPQPGSAPRGHSTSTTSWRPQWPPRVASGLTIRYPCDDALDATIAVVTGWLATTRRDVA